MDSFFARKQHINTSTRSQDGAFFLILAVMVVAIYWKFLFGVKTFVLTDVGSDSYYQTVPILMDRARTIFTDGCFARYNILLSLGQFETALNLTDALLTVFGAKSVPYMMGLFQAFKTFLAGLLFYRFIREHGFEYRSCVLTALGYAFNGAMLTRLAFFSYSNEYMFVALALYALELYYRRGNRWLFPIASLLLVQSFDAVRAIFYFLFFAVYTAFRCILDGEKTRLLFLVKRVARVMGLQLLGYAMAAVLILPWYSDLIASNRLSTVSSDALSGQSEIVNGNAIITSFLRLFSNEILGNAETYSGRNSYVCGPAFVMGILNVLILPQILILTTKKKRVLYLLALGAIGAYLFLSPLRVLMNGFAYDRFKLTSFWITILMLYFSAIAWERFFREGVFSRRLFLLTGCGVLVVLTAVIVLFSNILTFDKTATVITFTLIVASMLAVVLVYAKKTALFSALLIGVLAVDLVINSYTSVDNRKTLTVGEYEASYLVSGIDDLATSLRESDTDYFRICNYDSSYRSLRCDGQANNYLSTSTYDGGSGLSDAYNRFAALVGGGLLNSQGYRAYANNDFITMSDIQTLLGVRYVIYTPNSYPSNPAVPYGYTLTEQDGYRVLKNEHALPLAIAFDSVIAASTLADMPQIERRESLLHNAMVGDDSALLYTALAVATEPERDLEAILANTAIPLTLETTLYTETYGAEVTVLTAELARPIESEYALVRADVDSTEGLNAGETFTISWAGTDGAFTSGNSMWYSMPPGMNELLIELPIQGAQYVRIETDRANETIDLVTVSEEDLDYFSSYASAVEKLRSQEFLFAKLSNRKIEGRIELENPALLMFTFLTDPGWSATVNGEPVYIELVDDAFIGVYLEAGENSVTLRYAVPHSELYTCISSVAAVAYVALVLATAVKDKKRRKTTPSGEMPMQSSGRTTRQA